MGKIINTHALMGQYIFYRVVVRIEYPPFNIEEEYTIGAVDGCDEFRRKIDATKGCSVIELDVMSYDSSMSAINRFENAYAEIVK